MKHRYQKLCSATLNNTVEKTVCSITPLTTRTTYSACLSKMVTSPTCENKIFKYRFTKENIQNVYVLPFTTTRYTKIITFQYKVIHNIHPNQLSLTRAGKMKLVLCNTEKLTKIYMLYSCPELTAMFSGRFTDWWYQKFKQNLILNECIILYGWHEKSRNEQVLNYALLAKYRFSSTSVRNNKLDFDSFLLRLRTKLNIFKEVSLEKKTFDIFHSTWAVKMLVLYIMLVL